MLKISVVSESDQGIEFELEGKLVGPWVDELSRLTRDALLQYKLVSLNLEDVWFVDARGAALLRELAGRQVSQQNCSQFVKQQLREAGQ